MNKQDWTYKKLGEVATIVGGSTPKSNIEEYWGGTNYWVTPADLDGNKYQGATPRTITDLAVQKTNLQLLPIGTVLLSSRAPIGKVAITTVPMYCNQGFKNVVCSDLLINEFVYWYLFGKVDYLNSLGRGATFKEISKRATEQIPIPVPPIAEQERIVAELDLLSGIIEKKKEQLKAYDQLAQSIFYTMFGDPIDNPKGWETKKLGEVCHHITDGDHMPPPKSDKGVPFLTISNVNKDKRELDFSNTFFVPQEYYDNLKDDRKARINDLLYTVTGSYGIPVIVRTSRPFCFQRHIALLKPIQEKVLTSFLFYWALCPSVKEEADNVATGIAQKTVGLNSLRKFNVILPPLSLQEEFAEKVEAIERQKALVQQSIVETQTMFDCTMDKYFG